MAASAQLVNCQDDEMDKKMFCAVKYIIVVGFHHTLGNCAEFVFPPLPNDPDLYEKHAACQYEPSVVQLPKRWRMLPFQALPDGAHRCEVDHCYFSVDSLEPGGRKLYAVSCYRQVQTHMIDPKNRGANVHRSSMQKSVVALCTAPYYGAIHARFSAITHAYFSEQDFQCHKILVEAYQVVRRGVEATSFSLNIGIPLSSLLTTFDADLLCLAKLILLQRKVAFFGFPASRVSQSVMAVLSLIPHAISDEILPVSEQLQQAGFPLRLFEDGYVTQPYVSIQQMEELKTAQGFFVGACNMLYARWDEIEVLVDVNSGEIDVKDNDWLRPVFVQTPADRRFMSEILRKKQSSTDEMGLLNSAVGSNQSELGHEEDESFSWTGSDPYIRKQFSSYFTHFLSAMTTVPDIFSPKHKGPFRLDAVTDYNWEWAALWINTPSFDHWLSDVRGDISEEISPIHPAVADQKESIFANITNRIFPGIMQWALSEEEVIDTSKVDELSESQETRVQSSLSSGATIDLRTSIQQDE